jgi:hypothetical protein
MPSLGGDDKKDDDKKEDSPEARAEKAEQVADANPFMEPSISPRFALRRS